MKHAFTKGLFVAATATLIAACSTDDAADQMPVAPGKIEVSLKAALPQSRAQIEVDESIQAEERPAKRKNDKKREDKPAEETEAAAEEQAE